MQNKRHSDENRINFIPMDMGLVKSGEVRQELGRRLSGLPVLSDKLYSLQPKRSYA